MKKITSLFALICLFSTLSAQALTEDVPNRDFTNGTAGWTISVCGIGSDLQPYVPGAFGAPGVQCWNPGAASFSVVSGATLGNGHSYTFADLGIPGVTQGALITAGNYGCGATGISPADRDLYCWRAGSRFPHPTLPR